MVWQQPAVRALLAFVWAALFLGSAGAVPVTTIDTPTDAFFITDGPPPPLLVEPPAFMVAGLRGMEDVALSAASDSAPIRVDASDPNSKLLLLLIRLTSKLRQAERDARYDAVLSGESPPPRLGDDDGLRVARSATHALEDESASMLIGPDPAAATATWAPANLSLETPRVASPISASPYLPPIATRVAPMSVESMTLPRMPLMPWICLLAGLVALAWLGWRTAG
jgi:hypothetical protein